LILDGYAGWHYAMKRTPAEVLLSMRLIEHRWGLKRRTKQEPKGSKNG
jgi:hypothetical protein